MSTNIDIAKKYARSFFRAAHGKRISKDLKTLQVVFTKTPRILTYISSPIHTRISRDQLVEQVCKKLALHTHTTNFLKIIAHNSRLHILGNIIEQYWQICREENNEQLVEVVSVKKLTKSQMAAIQTHFEDQLHKKVSVLNIQDRSILGGLIIKLGSLVIDNSISNKINNIQLLMTQKA